MWFVELIKLLESDGAEFFPYCKEYPYQRITAKVSVNDDVKTVFTPDPEAGYEIDDVVFNLDKFNMSVRAKVRGTINIPEAHLYGLDTNYPTYIWRTFTFLRAGEVHYKHMVALVSEELAETLVKEGLVIGTSPDGRIIIDISRCEVLPNTDEPQPLSREKFCCAHRQEIMSMAELKVLKHYYSLLKPKIPEEPNSYDEGVQRILADHFIKPDGSFSPPSSVSGEEVGFGKEITLQVKIKGLSSLPSVAAVEKKLSSGKPLTEAESLMAPAYEYVKAKMTYDNESMSEWLRNRIRLVKGELFDQRSAIIMAKLAMMKQYPWFKEPAESASCNGEDIVEQCRDDRYEFTIIRSAK